MKVTISRCSEFFGGIVTFKWTSVPLNCFSTALHFAALLKMNAATRKTKVAFVMVLLVITELTYPNPLGSLGVLTLSFSPHDTG